MIATQNAADKTQKFLDDFKVSKPVIGLPGLGWDTPEMAAAVSNAGGLGVLHIGFKTEEEIERDVAKVRSLTDKPFAVLMFPQKESILDAEKLRLQDTVQEGCGTEGSGDRLETRRFERTLHGRT